MTLFKINCLQTQFQIKSLNQKTFFFNHQKQCCVHWSIELQTEEIQDGQKSDQRNVANFNVYSGAFFKGRQLKRRV